MVGAWLESPNSIMVSYAQTVLAHGKWSPPIWWATHNARLCRPCLFFPRGKCTSDTCDYCHGPKHPKPKRPPKSKRATRKRFDRTPSPDFAIAGGAHHRALADLQAQPLSDRTSSTPSPALSSSGDGEALQPLPGLPAQPRWHNHDGEAQPLAVPTPRRYDRTPSPEQRIWNPAHVHHGIVWTPAHLLPNGMYAAYFPHNDTKVY